MTGAHHTPADFDDSLTKAEASEKIEELKAFLKK
jgi:hypothetical protein